MEVDPRSVYYFLQALTYLAVYSAVFVGSGVSLWKLGSTLSNCALRPTIVPRKGFLFLLRHLAYPSGCCLIPCLLLAAKFPDYFAARLLAAVCATVFHLGDCSRTGAHNGYLMLWNVWTFSLLSVRLSLGLAFGAAVWFILSSGISKLWIGGLAWCQRNTMQSILSSFVYKTPKAGGPVLNILCRTAIKYPVLCGIMGTGTVVFEVVYVSLIALMAPRSWQIVTVYLMLLLHIGIAVIQSSAIGVFFLPNVASYVVGFLDFNSNLVLRSTFPFIVTHSDASSSTSSVFNLLELSFGKISPAALDWQPLHGYCWFMGVLLNIIALVYSLATKKLIAEDWPFTPMALFPWSGHQWCALQRAFVEGDTRLVAIPPDVEDHIIKTSDIASMRNKLVGAAVVPIVGAAKLRDDERDCDALTADADNSVPSLWRTLRHKVFGTSPFAKDLLAHTLAKSKKKRSTSTRGSNATPLLNDDDSTHECTYLYDIWTRVLGPTTYQEEFLPALSQELMAVQQEKYDLSKGLPLFVNTVQTWLQSSGRLIEVSSGKEVRHCAFVKVNSEDVVEQVLSFGMSTV